MKNLIWQFEAFFPCQDMTWNLRVPGLFCWLLYVPPQLALVKKLDQIIDLLYFLWLPYPKSALKTWGAHMYLQDLLANIIFFLLFSAYTFSHMSIARPGTKVRDS